MDYITCNYKKNKAKLSTAVCMKCRRRRNCPDYGDYVQPRLFPDLFKGKITTRAEGSSRKGRAQVAWTGCGLWTVIILTIGILRAYVEDVSISLRFLIFSTRVVLLILRSFAAFVLTQSLFSKASRISLFS